MGSAAFCLLGRLIYYGCSLKGMHSQGKRGASDDQQVSVGFGVVEE